MMVLRQKTSKTQTLVLKTLSRLLLGICLLYPSIIFAKDVGVIGQFFPILEPDLLAYMQAKAAKMLQDGEWADKMQSLQMSTKTALENLTPVAGITPTSVARTWTLDPTITLQHTIYGANGQVIVPAGTTINPLDKMSLNETLIFFDARDKSQIAWAKSFLDNAKGQVKLILVAGNWIDLSKAWQRQVFFDVHGTITHRLQITHVPSVVTQQGRFLKIDEEVAS